METDKPKRKYTRRAKPMTPENTNEVAAVSATEQVVVTPEVLEENPVLKDAGVEVGAVGLPATPEQTAEMEQKLSEATTNPTENSNEVVQETVANLDGLKSCSRCGADESPTVKLTVVGNEKLCPNH